MPKVRPTCPTCGLKMITTEGTRLEEGQQTFRCLKCGHEERPAPEFMQNH
jgi:hypothetical protein